MGETGGRPIRETGWAFSFVTVVWRYRYPVRLVVLLVGVALACSVSAFPQHAPGGHEDHGVEAHQHHASSPSWEGSRAGIAYSEANHHLAGILVLLIGISELRQALGYSVLRWARLLLPWSLITTGIFLLIWSDHEAWPIGSLTLKETFWGSDPEILQHKLYGLLALSVGVIESLRRLGPMHHSTWAVPLPLFAIVGGLLLFGHSHGDHPGAQTIQLHHTVMGLLAITAGSSKLMSGWQRPAECPRGVKWAPWAALIPAQRFELAWALLIMMIGLQLVFYSE